MKSSLIFLNVITSCVILLFTITSCDGQFDCVIDLDKDITPNHPLILKEDGKSFLEPNKLEPIKPRGQKKFTAKIYLKKGDKLRLSCDEKKEIVLECDYGNQFNGRQFKEFTCNSAPKSKARNVISNICRFYPIEIGFQTAKSFITLFTTCFDYENKNALYSYHIVNSMILGSQSTSSRPDFIAGDFYGKSSQFLNDQVYSKVAQLTSIDNKLGVAPGKYIKNHVYLAKGHLTPMADFLYTPQQAATFYYVNAAPQWQNINNGNWKCIEEHVKKLAAIKQANLIVITGTYGVTTLPDKNNNPVNLALDLKDGKHKIIVPEIYWKVIYNQYEQSGIALVTHNNPYNQYNVEDKICTDICRQLTWLNACGHWAPEVITKGYSYCCEVSELKQKVPYLPNLIIRRILN